MSQWQTGDGFRLPSQSRDVLQSWSNNNEEANHAASVECWGPQVRPSSFHFDPSQLGHNLGRQQVDATPLATRFDPPREETPLAARLELTHNERHENALWAGESREMPLVAKEVQATPLSQIYDILDVHSDSSRWLSQRGYLDSFNSPNCTLDLNFSLDARGNKVGAVMTAPDGSKRTVVACEGGTTFQRLTAPDGRELVKFLSSGQIVELTQQRI